MQLAHALRLRYTSRVAHGNADRGIPNEIGQNLYHSRDRLFWSGKFAEARDMQGRACRTPGRARRIRSSTFSRGCSQRRKPCRPPKPPRCRLRDTGDGNRSVHADSQRLSKPSDAAMQECDETVERHSIRDGSADATALGVIDAAKASPSFSCSASCAAGNGDGLGRYQRTPTNRHRARAGLVKACFYSRFG
jgi:hypothetical protein